MADMTPDDAATRLAVLWKQIKAIDAQAATIVGKLIAGRETLAGLSAQRQPLVDEVDQINRTLLAAKWRDDLRASGDQTSP